MRRVMSVLGFAIVLSPSCGDDDPVEVLECTGTCSCEEETRSCSCQGGSECVVGAASDVTLVCEGNASCDLECGVRCHVECPGTAGCAAAMGDDSTAICNGTGTCEYTCGGDCQIDCPGASACIVRCAEGATCEVTSCLGPSLVDCGDGVLACRTDCPTM